VSIDIKSLGRDELAARFAEWGQPGYRVDQLLEWLYPRRAAAWDAMTNLPKELREKLASELTLQTLGLVLRQGARDTTQKFLWKLTDGAMVESVLIPANPALYGDASDRHTLCVSTQVGCAYGCKFCASGLDGWKRNLRPEEIVEQVFSIERLCAEDDARTGEEDPKWADKSSGRAVDNLVIMGMGEPLANYDNLIKALRLLNASWGGGIGARKITISTSGVVPKIKQLAAEPEQFRLAISLHGATDAVRDQIMPVNRKYPLAMLTAACEEFVKAKGKMITLEYILLAGVNDGLDQTRPLGELARRLNAKVNLIPYNTVEGLPWVRPEAESQERFLAAVEQFDVPVTLRREKGHDIDAACGQLRLKTEREMAMLSPELVAGSESGCS
jgi:23S rRNA (adenine2503-C2)-methyltransferase